jgi:hypothetical protein
LTGEDRVHALVEFGFTERQASFLVTVMRAYGAFQTVVREELETPLHRATISELRWYFEDRQQAIGHGVDAQTQAFLDRAAQVFNTLRFTLLYRRWLKQGDAAFRGCLVTRHRGDAGQWSRSHRVPCPPIHVPPSLASDKPRPFITPAAATVASFWLPLLGRPWYPKVLC